MTSTSSFSIETTSRLSCMTPDSASVISMRVVSIVNTRSDSSTQSANASPAAGSLVDWRRPRRCCVTWRVACANRGNIVQRFPHTLDQALILVEQAIELPSKLLQIGALTGHLHASGHVACVNDAACRGDNVAHRFRCRWQIRHRPDAKQKRRYHHRQKTDAEGRKVDSRLLVWRPTSSVASSGNLAEATTRSLSSSLGIRNQTKCAGSPPVAVPQHRIAPNPAVRSAITRCPSDLPP